MNSLAFDFKAVGYDEEFTQTYVGSYQRKLVHQMLSKYWGRSGELNILEINCGTGEDIPVLKQYGKVLATDVSPEMLKIAQQKNPDTACEILDLSVPIVLNEKYDLIFSNFGGLNCLDTSRLKQLNFELADLLNPGGHLIAVMMHKWCFMEWLYFMQKFNFKKAFRRIRGKSVFNDLPIYYYTKLETIKIFHSFRMVDFKPMGVLLSGEYMNRFGKWAGLSDGLISNAWPVLGADHILYTFNKK